MKLPALLLVGGFVSAGTAEAITLGFDPASQQVSVGSSVSVRVAVSDLGNGAAPSLGTFDLDVLYDPAVLGFTGVVFGDPVLGDQLDLAGGGSLVDFDASAAGALNLFELSVDLPADLDDLQAGAFTLATLTFEALAPGTSSLDFSALVLGDSLGDPLDADALSAGSITVVPEPAPSSLTLLGILLLALARRIGPGALPRGP